MSLIDFKNSRLVKFNTSSEKIPLSDILGPGASIALSQKYHSGHKAWDVAVVSQKVYSPGSGKVTNWALDGEGNSVLAVKFPVSGITLEFVHVKDAQVKIGDSVSPGQLLATTGGQKGGWGAGQSTGPHLHLEVYKDGVLVNPGTVFSLT